MTRRKRDIYVAIMVAEARGTGINLTFEELQDLVFDDAIATRAANSLTAAEWQSVFEANESEQQGWSRIDPFKDREPGNMAIGG